MSWEKVLRLLVVNRLLDGGSEFRVHRQWFIDSAMDELLETDFAVADKDRLYRCLDRVLAYKQELFVWLQRKWAELFAADFEVRQESGSQCFLVMQVHESGQLAAVCQPQQGGVP